jgi:F-type H+-transporting ATPase subunit gamma
VASIRELKRRIKSVKNISQVTRAMQMVAASRMRRAQEQALASRPYAAKAWEVLVHLASQQGATEQLHPLLTHRDDVKNMAIILITADKGLAGAYNSNMIRATSRFMREHDQREASLITVGRKGRDFMVRYGRNVVAEFADLPAQPTTLDIGPIARLAVDGFLADEYDEVYLAYTNFINTLQQEPTIDLLLPIQPGRIEGKVMSELLDYETAPGLVEYVYEPNPATLASEHSARMVAMRNATENAKELISDLTLTYNKVRQDAITKEMLDIAGGAEALSQASR